MGAEILIYRDTSYLYERYGVWDSGKKRAKKVSGKYLGVITPDGLIRPKHERIIESMKNITVKEFGATWFILENNKDIMELLRTIYPYW